jgi:hypothetical protein
MIMELAACSLKLKDYSLTLEAIAEKCDDVGLTLENLGACGLKLDAWAYLLGACSY